MSARRPSIIDQDLVVEPVQAGLVGSSIPCSRSAAASASLLSAIVPIKRNTTIAIDTIINQGQRCRACYVPSRTKSSSVRRAVDHRSKNGAAELRSSSLPVRQVLLDCNGCAPPPATMAEYFRDRGQHRWSLIDASTARRHLRIARC